MLSESKQGSMSVMRKQFTDHKLKLQDCRFKDKHELQKIMNNQIQQRYPPLHSSDSS